MYFIFQWSIITSHDASCKIHIFLNKLLSTFSAWLIMLVAIERVLAILKPFKVAILFNRRNIICMLISIIIVISLLYIPAFWCRLSYQVIFNEEGNKFEILYRCIESKYFIVTRLFHWIDIFVRSAIPFVFLCFTNVIIIYSLRKAERFRKTISSTPDAENNQVAFLTALLLATSFTHLVTTLPTGLYYLVLPYTLPYYNYSRDAFLSASHLWLVSCGCLGYLNNSVNFVMYCIAGRRFRVEFVCMIMCKKKPITNPHSANTQVTMDDITQTHHSDSQL